MPDSRFQRSAARFPARLRAWGPIISRAFRDGACYPVGDYRAPVAEAQQIGAPRTGNRFDHVGRNQHWRSSSVSWTEPGLLAHVDSRTSPAGTPAQSAPASVGRCESADSGGSIRGLLGDGNGATADLGDR